MSNALSLISSMTKEGKSPLEVAKELHARGLKNEQGKTISPAMVSGYLRFIGVSAEPEANYMPAIEPISSSAVWGRKHEPTTVNASVMAGPVPSEKRKSNRVHAGSRLSDELKARVKRLYQQDAMKVDEIAKELGVHPRKIGPFCSMLAGFAALPGEVIVVVENGREISKCPPGYARGAYPQRNVGMKGR